MREAVAEMLAEARRNLPEGYEIIPVSGWRSAVEQAALQQDFCNRLKRKYPELTSADLVQQTKKWCADSGGHQTGGAVDVQLWYQGRKSSHSLTTRKRLHSCFSSVLQPWDTPHL